MDQAPTKPVSQNRQKKEALVAELFEKVKKSKAIVFANYQGMTHLQIEAMKKALKGVNAEMVVTKNTLVKIALKLGKLPADAPLEGGTITLFAYDDVVAPIKEITKSFKALKLPEVKFGILDGKSISAEQVIKLSTLPSKDMLLAMVAAGLKSPISGLHRALNWNLQKFVMTLKAIEAKKV